MAQLDHLRFASRGLTNVGLNASGTPRPVIPDGMKVHLVNPSDMAFGTAVITPRWLYVLAAATPAAFGDPVSATRPWSSSTRPHSMRRRRSASAFTPETRCAVMKWVGAHGSAAPGWFMAVSMRLSIRRKRSKWGRPCGGRGRWRCDLGGGAA